MQTGVINQENLSEVFRAVAQRRQSGVLEITSGGENHRRHLELVFLHGKLVEVIRNGESPVEAVLGKLKDTGHLVADEEFATESYQALYDDIQDRSENAHVVTRELITDLIEGRIQEYVRALQDSDDAYYNFNHTTFAVEESFAPSLSVGALLLDLVDLEVDGSSLEDSSETVAPSDGSGEEVTDLSAVDDIVSFLEEEGPPVAPVPSEKESPVSEPQVMTNADEMNTEQPVDEQHESVEEENLETEKQSISRPASATLNYYNGRLLYSDWVPVALCIGFIAAAIAVPLLFWGDVFHIFGRR